jgi:hypothetical protein
VEYLNHLFRRHDNELKEDIPLNSPVAQSGTEKNLEVNETAAGIDHETNVEFSDPVKQYDLVVGRKLEDMTYKVSEVGKEDDLSTFMSRPIRIFTKTWEVGESPNYVNAFNPWLLFLQNARVKHKLETFKLLQGTLMLKIMINGSPFHYGKMFVGVRPTRHDNNTILIDPVTPVLTSSYKNANTNAYKSLNVGATLYSQRPHVFLDPSTNQPQSIEWPFFVAGNYIDLTDIETVYRMGVIEMWELSKLKHANGATDPVEISIFAWMTNVSFAGLTAGAVANAQSGMEKRPKNKKGSNKAPKFNGMSKAEQGEYKKDGVISAPASTVKELADYFTAIPVIGPFAKATSIGAGAVSNIAKLFGYAKPPVLTDTMFVRPQNIGNLSNTSGSDPIQKLSLDPKQELTIDPGTVGLTPDDQMAFGYITKREAFIDNFQWNTLTTQNTGLIYSILVHPFVAPNFRIDIDPIDANTPLTLVSRPFGYWSGSLRYRFQIVASQFHRGRLMFVYEPTHNVSGTVQDTNNRFAHIVDISEERDVTFEVNWTQETAYGRLDNFPTIDMTIEGDGNFFVDAKGYANGRVSVFVVNQLAAPVDSANVEVNVFISAGDSFEVKMPISMGLAAYARNSVPVGPPAIAQSGKEVASGATVTSAENMPEQDTMYILNGNPTCTQSEQSDVYFGEAIVSCRSLLKRYCFHRVLALPQNLETASIYLNIFDQCNFPNGPGPTYGSSQASSLTRIVGPADYNICAMTYLRWFSSAFIGYRGGIRWKVTLFNEDMDIMSVRVVRDKFNGIDDENLVVRQVITGSTSQNEVAQNFLAERTYYSTTSGAAVTAANVNPTVEYEIPYYNNYRFTDINAPKTSIEGYHRSDRHMISYTSRHEANDNFSWIETHCAIGEDFSFFFFIGAPPTVLGDAATIAPL